MHSRSEKKPELIWWEQASGPSLFLREAAETLRSGKHLCLLNPDPLPWREFFFERLKEAVRESDNALLFEELDGAAEDPGGLLVGHFDTDAYYRPTKTYSEFLSQSKILADRIICVTAETAGSAQRWLDFLKEYRPLSRRSGLMLIEVCDMPLHSAPQHLRTLSYRDFVSEYDTQVFAGLFMPDHQMSIEQKKYLAAITTSLLGIDAPGAAKFVRSFRYDRDNPELFEGMAALSDADRARRVWNAQVQTLFPLIMREFREFIDKWRGKIDDAFTYADKTLHYGLLDSNRERITSTDEIEIATIRYLMRTRRRHSDNGGSGDYILYIPDENARARIELLYDMRNRLAHGKVCSIDDVVSLLTSSDSDGAQPSRSRIPH
jgi:hypothetical protein